MKFIVILSTASFKLFTSRWMFEIVEIFSMFHYFTHICTCLVLYWSNVKNRWLEKPLCEYLGGGWFTRRNNLKLADEEWASWNSSGVAYTVIFDRNHKIPSRGIWGLHSITFYHFSNQINFIHCANIGVRSGNPRRSEWSTDYLSDSRRASMWQCHY